MRTTKTRFGKVWIALWLTLSGACSPAVDPLPEPCVESPTIRSVASDSFYPILVVGQRLDAAGDTYQSFRLMVDSPLEMHTTEDLSSPHPDHSLALYINNHRQRAYVWNNTAIGPWRITSEPQMGQACSGFVYEITVGTTTHGPCGEVVCRGLQDTDVVEVRVDSCNWRTGVCTSGIPSLLRVSVIPL